MSKAGTLAFDHLLQLVECTPDVLVASLEACACIVDDRWIVSSRILYPADPYKAACWEYILLTFTRSQFVTRRQVQRDTGLSLPDIHTMLSKISVITHPHGWALRIHPEKEMFHLFPYLRSKYTNYWAERTKTILNRLSTSGTSSSSSSSSSASSSFSSSSSSSVSSSSPSSHLSDLQPFSQPNIRQDDADRLRRFRQGAVIQAKEWLRKLFIQHGVLSHEFILHQLSLRANPESISDQLNYVSPRYLTQEVLEEILTELTTSISPSLFVLATPENPLLAPCREVIVRLFSTSPILTKRAIIEACKTEIERVPTATEYNAILHELAVSHKGSWKLKLGQGLEK